MTPTAVYAGPAARRDEWIHALRDAAMEAELDIRFVGSPEETPPEQTDYLLYAPDGPLRTLAPYAGVKAILSLWAGVETILTRPDLPDAPLVRMVEPGLTEGMRDYVVGHALRAHLRVDELTVAQAERRWDASLEPPLARNRRIGVLGLGALGSAAAEAFVALGFQVAGWSRRAKTVPGVENFAGPEALPRFLSRSEILICLLPLTAETRGLLGAANLAHLPKGAHIVNAGRGPIIDDAALLDALRGHLGGATLDVFATEPLPEDHPFWTTPNVLVTPHVASVTRPETASQRVVFHIGRRESGAPFLDLVDRAAGY